MILLPALVKPYEGDNGRYVKQDGTDPNFNPYLWEGEIADEDIISDPKQIETDGWPNEENLQKIANALIPHAMKATAGLYRLFWHEAPDA